MSIAHSVETIVDRIQHSAGSESVFGEPIAAEGKTIIPVARVRYGFGGGFGSAEGGADQFGESEAAEGAGGEGGGFGGGVDAAPVGVVEITEAETRFVRFGDRRRLVGLFLAGVALGGLLARRSAAERE